LIFDFIIKQGEQNGIKTRRIHWQKENFIDFFPHSHPSTLLATKTG